MKSFSIRRVAHYARYHYSVTRFNYLSYIVAMIALPALFGILGKSLHTAEGMLIPIYIYAGLAMAVATTRMMRGRGTKIMDSVLPVTAAERHVFNVFNLAVVYPVLFAFVAAVALGIVSIFDEFSISFGDAYYMLVYDTLLVWPIYVLIQIVCSASLLINILARRSLILAYTLTFFGGMTLLVLSIFGVGVLFESLSFDVHFGPEDMPSQSTLDAIAVIFKVLYCLIPVAIYALGYVALRKRQVKW